MTPDDVYQLTLVAAAGVLAPIIVAGLRRFAIPSVVLEISFGIVLGPQVLDLVQPTGLVDGLSVLGLSMLMFLAGYELKLDTIRGRPLKLAGLSWGLSVVLVPRSLPRQRPPPLWISIFPLRLEHLRRHRNLQ